MRAATYCRYSSDQQRESSIADQQRNCHTRARSEGWNIIHDYADAAISGSNGKRPQYQRMLAAGVRREFDVLLLDDLSRLTRDAVEQETALRRLEFAGVRVVGLSDGYDSQSASRKVTRTIRALQNEMFVDDLAAKVHRGQKGQALLKRWNGGKPYGYRLRPILDASQRDPYGNPLKVGTELEVDKAQASVVREIFERYARGESCLTIAAALNGRGEASPAVTWKRTVRRADKWVDSAVRVILRNPLYRGQLRWNVSQFVRNPDTGKHLRRTRPRSDWVVNQVEALRIVSDELFAAAHERTRVAANSDARLKSGGKARFVLSGLLVCSVCKSHYMLGDKHKYACGSFLRGRACSNQERVRRDHLENVILTPVREELLAPERVARIAKELAVEYAARLKTLEKRATELPAEVQQIDARLARLRERLRRGDEDLTAAELQGVIERLEGQLARLLEYRPMGTAHDSAKLFAMLPRAAEEYRKQIAAGLDGDPEQATAARVLLRDFLGPITLEPGKRPGELWARYQPSFHALLKVAGTGYRGDRI